MAFYAYIWLREDGTPYYVGKGTKKRATYSDGHIPNRPRDRSQIIMQEHPSEEEAFQAERFLIEFFGKKCNNTGILVNILDGGLGGIVNPGKGRLWSPEQRRQISERMKGNTLARGAKRSPEFIEHIRRTHLGRKYPPEVRRKVSESLVGNTRNKGHRWSEESRDKMRNRIISAVTCAKLSAAAIRRYHGVS